MSWYNALRLRGRPGGGRWLAPSAERVLVDVLAVLMGVAGELTLLYDDESPIRPGTVLLTVIAGTALFGRRRYPAALLAAMVAVTGLLFALGESPGGVLVCVALFTVAERCRARVSVLALIGATVVLVALSVTSVPPPVAVWAVGAALRGRRRHHDDLRARATAARAEREQQAAIAAHEERAAIARELHDIVAHSVTVMLVGARGARDVLPTAPDVAADVLRRVESSGEQSIAELRRLLALLRSGVPAATSSAAPHRPLPGLAELAELAATFRAVGLSVSLEIDGEPPVVDEGVGVSVYRIVEEALTNVLRHAGTDHALVRLRARQGHLDLEVSDRGVGPSGQHPPAGHGLVGMRERVRLLGGTFAAGPGPDGGFRVAARVPISVYP
ncbi:sensor histidine kinase [Plantactinospora endophytica]|uniref:histidine kinase n=1 Tax=Plantactinospora endophytica TaxID=673535 RepID=A0ABQ4ED92_9ACTN|nr:histidine kinase [Plantactinospora endophytica]GIG92677.1 two-component sensor histidine kinase [Plantactinospora endophytica]